MAGVWNKRQKVLVEVEVISGFGEGLWFESQVERIEASIRNMNSIGHKAPADSK